MDYLGQVGRQPGILLLLRIITAFWGWTIAGGRGVGKFLTAMIVVVRNLRQMC
jgi:hypothetical protein